SPANATELNNLAWLILASPDPKFRSARWLVDLARRAVELRPGKATFWRTLGVAHYRAGDWKSAAEALERPQQLGLMDGPARFCLAVAHWQLGNVDEASRWYREGLAWMETHSDDAVLRRFHDEAVQVLGLEDEKK